MSGVTDCKGETVPSIVVVGSCMIDLSCFAPRLPLPGETLHGSSFNVGFGGKGANQAVAAAKLGAKVEMVARLGDDSYGKEYLKSFEDSKVGHKYVIITPGQHSGIAQITVADSGENQIVIVPGANSSLCKRDVDQAKDILQNASVAVCQLETNPNLVLDTANIVRPAGGILILNAAPARPDLSTEILTCCDILCVNETEAGMIAGCKVSSVADAQSTVTTLLANGCKCVLLTLGSQGAVFASQSEPTPVHVTSPTVNAVDTTGAGDAFIGALAYYLAYESSLPMKEIVFRSCNIASVSVQKRGTQQSFPTKDQLSSNLFS